MRILIFEYITGGGMVDRSLPPSLAREGGMMANAAASDFGALSNVHVSTLKDYRISANRASSGDILIKSGDTYAENIEKLNQQIDALLVIAPETNEILSSICERFSSQAFVLLNSRIDSIRLTSNKYDTYKYLQAHGIPQIPTYLPNEINDLSADKFIMKPVDGMGCKHLYLLSSRIDLDKTIEKHIDDRYIIQPFINGVHASLSLICWEGKCHLLSCNEQRLVEKDGSLVLKSCKVNVFGGEKFKSFSKELVQTLPGLRGYVGVDILIEGEKILLVEINPRLTTSYIGLRSALGVNPAELLLHCFVYQKLPIFKATKNNKITIEVEADRAAQ